MDATAPPSATDAVEPDGPSPLTDLVEAAAALAASATPGNRRVLGITGAPAAGKSTLAAALVGALGPGVAVAVPMDGFHLSDQTLAAMGRLEAKGAPDTFDAGGYAALLERLRTATAVVHAPRFDRHLEESIGSAVPVDPGVPLVVTEGNYLLLDAAVAAAVGVQLDADALAAWAAARAQVDQVWFVELDDAVRIAAPGRPPRRARPRPRRRPGAGHRGGPGQRRVGRRLPRARRPRGGPKVINKLFSALFSFIILGV